MFKGQTNIEKKFFMETASDELGYIKLVIKIKHQRHGVEREKEKREIDSVTGENTQLSFHSQFIQPILLKLEEDFSYSYLV